MSILALQPSWWGRESWLLCLICLHGVSWWLSGSSSRCHGFVCSLWLWYFLIILTYYFTLETFPAKTSGDLNHHLKLGFGRTHDMNALPWRLLEKLYLSCFVFVCVWFHFWKKVRKTARIRKRYNQIPNLSQDTKWESNKLAINIANKSQEVSPFPSNDHKAAMNRRQSMTNTRHK